MKSFIVLAVLVAAALAGPLNPDGDAFITGYESESNAETGSYKYTYGTSNGIFAHEESLGEELGPDGQPKYVHGYYQFQGDDGETYRVDYTADNEGFHPTGNHLPVAPVA